MAEYAPVFNLHLLLWDLPGFSFLRAPGRFSYLVVFACAGLAAFGLQALVRTRRAPACGSGWRLCRPSLPLGGAAGAVAALARLAGSGSRAGRRTWAQTTYLATRAQYPIDPQLVVNGFLTSLDLTTVKTAWSLALLALTALASSAGSRSDPSERSLGQALFVGLLAVDLLVFAYDFHPRLPLLSLTPTLPGVRLASGSCCTTPTTSLSCSRISCSPKAFRTTDGYSSLPSQRHVELESFTSTQTHACSICGARRFVLEPQDPADATLVDGVHFRSQHPLVAGFGGSTPTGAAASDIAPGTGLRLIGTLNYAYNVPQGQTVATLRVRRRPCCPSARASSCRSVPTIGPSLKGLVQHQKAPSLSTSKRRRRKARTTSRHLYEADLAVPARARRLDHLYAHATRRCRSRSTAWAWSTPVGAVTSLDLGQSRRSAARSDESAELLRTPTPCRARTCCRAPRRFHPRGTRS